MLIYGKNQFNIVKNYPSIKNKLIKIKSPKEQNSSECFSHATKQSLQFWHDLPERSIRLHRVRTASRLPPFQMPTEVQVATCASD